MQMMPGLTEVYARSSRSRSRTTAPALRTASEDVAARGPGCTFEDVDAGVSWVVPGFQVVDHIVALAEDSGGCRTRATVSRRRVPW